ncbi:hypothetical protein [Labilibaculum manganireducens]|uniref:hypothetical protein n=1 Tax=Labilibaculum manganireducens TaxID=1940525 RepID=UPI0029F53F81|nr:hypothetical protein [Labilibaculum manganireducens]
MKDSLPGYKKVFEKLKVTLPTNSTFEIILEIFEEDGETEVHVNAKYTALVDGIWFEQY